MGAVAVGSSESAGESPSRFVDPTANNRLEWWGEALRIVRAKPLGGAGADTFKVARKRYRDEAVETVEPHDVPLQVLAGTGPVGLLLFVSFLAAAAWAAAAALRRLEGAERAAAAALAVFPALWLFHALVDFPWNFVAVTGPALFAVGVLAAAGREPRRVRSPFAAAGALALCVAAVASAGSPWLAERSVREVSAALERGEPAAAADAADRARSLDPLALEPLLALARVQESTRQFDAARRTYGVAVRLQPENPEAWLELGLFEASRGDLCAAYFDLNHAYTLDPAGTQWVEGGPLDRARAFVNAGKVRLVAEHECEVRAEHVLLSEPVERPDDLHLQILRKPHGLGPVAVAVHDDRPCDVPARGIADRSDRVTERADAVGACGCGSRSAVAVEDDHRGLGACQLRLRGRHRLPRLRLDRSVGLRLGGLPHVLRHGAGEQRDREHDQHDELEGGDRDGDEGGRPPRRVDLGKRMLHGRLVSPRPPSLLLRRSRFLSRRRPRTPR